MKSRTLYAALLLSCLAAPASAVVAINEAHDAARNPASFDGARVRAEGAPVPEDTTDTARRRTLAAANPKLAAVTAGPDADPTPPAPEWRKGVHITNGVKGALIGLLVGSLWGMTGLGIGLLVGGMIGYGLSRLKA